MNCVFPLLLGSFDSLILGRGNIPVSYQQGSGLLNYCYCDSKHQKRCEDNENEKGEVDFCGEGSFGKVRMTGFAFVTNRWRGLMENREEKP